MMAGGLEEVEAVREIDLGRDDEVLEEVFDVSETVGRRRGFGASCWGGTGAAGTWGGLRWGGAL
jgi:hypothetical protein